MFGSVAQLGWDGSLTRARVQVVAAALALAGCISGCSNELEVTTEYIDPETDEASPLGPLATPAAPDAPLEDDSNLPMAAGQEGTARPPALDGASTPGAATPGADGAQMPIELAPAEQVPSTEHCAAVEDWDPLWVQFEEEVLLLVNEARSQPADCGEDGQFAAAGPLVMDPILRCSARLHSLDMFERHFFSHTNPDGKDPFQRMGAAGFRGAGAAENIAVGQTSPAQVMQSWMDSDSHCSNVMRRNYTLVGVGYHPGVGKRGLSSNFWTQNFGAPPRSCSRNCR